MAWGTGAGKAPLLSVDVPWPVLDRSWIVPACDLKRLPASVYHIELQFSLLSQTVKLPLSDLDYKCLGVATSCSAESHAV